MRSLYDSEHAGLAGGPGTMGSAAVTGGAERLCAAGMPAEEAHRLAEEWEWHRQDLMEEGLAAGMGESEASATADARLGNALALEREAIRRFRRRTFIGRHAWFFFGAAALPAVLGCYFLPLILALTLGREVAETDMGRRIQGIHPVFTALVNCGVPLLMATVFGRAARRRGLGVLWRLVPAVTCTISGALVFMDLEVGGLPSHGMLMIAASTQVHWCNGLMTLAAGLLSAGLIGRLPGGRFGARVGALA